MISDLFGIGQVPTRCNQLANTTIFAALNLFLLLLAVISTVFKVRRIIKRDRIQGLALGSLFLGVPFFISQLCIAITGSIVLFPGIQCLPVVVSLGLSAFNPTLLLLSSLVTAIGSLILFVLALKLDLKERLRNHESEALEDPSRSLSQPKPLWTYTQIVYSEVVALHIVVCFPPAILSLIISTVDRRAAEWIFWVNVICLMYFHLTILPFLTIIQFIPQIKLLWKERLNLEQLPLDIPAFVLDTIVAILLGISWRQYILSTRPDLVDPWYGINHAGDWLQWWGTCIWFDYALFGLWQGFVAILYLSLRSWNSRQSNPVVRNADIEEHASEQASEETPLL